MIIYKLEVIYNKETYKQEYGDDIDITNALIALLEKGYITDNTYNEISDFIAEVVEMDSLTNTLSNAMIHPTNNIKLEIEKIDENDDHTIDALLRR